MRELWFYWRLFRPVVLLASVLAAVWGVLGLRQISLSAPNYSGERRVEGLISEVEIIRDLRAVPHIFAKAEEDALFALGYVHAQDRLWQMELRRRLAAGALSEVFYGWAAWVDFFDWLAGGDGGRAEALLRVDLYARTLDFYGAAEASLGGFSPEDRRRLSAYAAGVNARLDEIASDGLGRGAPEIWLLGVEVAPWRPVDSVAAVKLMAASLSATALDEFDRVGLEQAVGPARAADLTREADGAAFSAQAFAAVSAGPADRVYARVASALGAPFAPEAARMAGASNLLAAASSRAAAGAPLLGADPHLPLTAPSLWHVARLSWEAPEGRPGHLYGAAIPGAPAFLIGRSDRLAWGLASLPVDVADFYLERLDPADSSRYWTGAAFAPFEARRELIAIGGGEAVAAVVRRTPRGPVLPLSWPGAAAATPAGHAPSLRWTALATDDTTLAAAMALNRAASVEEAAALAAQVVAPPLSVAVASASSIALFTAGRAPLRDARHETAGRTPSAGWRPENAWVGALPVGALPRAIDPPEGVVAAANSRPSGARAAFPKHLAHAWPADHRYRRLRALLDGRDFHTLAGFQAIQNDQWSGAAALLAPRLIAAAEAATAPRSELAAAALARLKSWGFEMDALAPEPLIYAAWARETGAGLIEDDLGAATTTPPTPSIDFIARALGRPAAAERWCDDRRTALEESCADIVAAALERAVAGAAAAQGRRIERWRWGRAHLARHAHAPFSGAPLLGALFDIVQETGGGDHTVLRGRTAGRGATPEANIHAGGFRAVFDFADLDRSAFALATGQSGHLMSRHYDDFAELWRGGDYAPMSLARRDAEINSVGVTRLSPR